MPADEKKFLLEQHERVMSAPNMFIEYQKVKATLDADEQIAFWSLFDSKQRSALKASSQETTAQA